jgi:hypothetical protein
MNAGRAVQKLSDQWSKAALGWQPSESASDCKPAHICLVRWRVFGKLASMITARGSPALASLYSHDASERLPLSVLQRWQAKALLTPSSVPPFERGFVVEVRAGARFQPCLGLHFIISFIS